jgi:short-subunit dehydrogenase
MMRTNALGETFRDRVVLITGASEGIGAACARAFRARGARLALNSRSADKLSRVAASGELVLPFNISEDSAARKVIEGTLAKFGRIDIVVNNAGAGLYGPAAKTSLSDARSLFELNLFAPMALIQAVLPHMQAQRSGTIVNVGSVAGDVLLPWMPFYSASKSALAILSDSLRVELKTFNIHVMHVRPGYVLTGFQAHALGQAPGRVVDRKNLAITPERCAADILHGLERRARTVTTPRWTGLLIAANRFMPSIVQARMNRMSDAAEHP